MKDGFIKVASASLECAVANPQKNREFIINAIINAEKSGVKLLCLPELCITSYTCGDLFFTKKLIDEAAISLFYIIEKTKNIDIISVVGLPIRLGAKLFNCAAVIQSGKILGIVPKTYIPDYGEFYEKRQFSSSADTDTSTIDLSYYFEQYALKYTLSAKNEFYSVPFGKMIFVSKEDSQYAFGVELCEDMWSCVPPSRELALSGASIIINCSASDEIIGKQDYRRELVKSGSAAMLSAYIYSSASFDESTQDMVFSGHCMICENGSVLAEKAPFDNNGMIISEVDVHRLFAERHKNTSFHSDDNIRKIIFAQIGCQTTLTRKVEKNPFVPKDKENLFRRAKQILQIQSYGLRKRVIASRAKSLVIGISGGLDSCLALLVAVRACDLLNLERTFIKAVTMPCFGTTKRTKSNACKLCEYLGVDFREVDITEAVRIHFRDIGHDEGIKDVTYENCQARERTQLLMDIANQFGGLVVGTGDLSELALGWATYNGDHMSMYAVNCSIPKTLVRYLVDYEAQVTEDKQLSEVLYDILATPVSPELLPAENGEISQKTEDIVGPYELHDFFIYYFCRFGFSKEKIYRLARYAFCGDYDDKTIKKWLDKFFVRFFTQQFKRSCIPDGPKVGTVTLSPRGDLRMPSDADGEMFFE